VVRPHWWREPLTCSERQRALDAGYGLYELPVGHDTMIAAPELTTQTLLTIAERSTTPTTGD
jgi:hypothetical protein